MCDGFNSSCLARSPEEMNGKRSAKVELYPLEDLQLHPDDVPLCVRLVRDVHKVLDLEKQAMGHGNWTKRKI